MGEHLAVDGGMKERLKIGGKKPSRWTCIKFGIFEHQKDEIVTFWTILIQCHCSLHCPVSIRGRREKKAGSKNNREEELKLKKR